MNAQERVDNVILKTKGLLANNTGNYFVYINKTNRFITITNDSKNRTVEEWSEGNNDIFYGSFSFSEAVTFAKVFSDLHHIEYRESFNIRTTFSQNNNDTKAF